MKKVIATLLVSITLTSAIIAQNATVTLTMYVTKTGHSEYGSTGGNCWESGDEEYTGLVWFWTDADGNQRGGSCRQCTANGNCNNTSWTDGYTYTSTSAYVMDARLDGWEDDGTRCSYGSGDDCRTQKNLSAWTGARNFQENAMPSNGSYHYYGDGANQFGDDDNWAQIGATWKFSGTGTTITPGCSSQDLTLSSGRIRSVAVNLTAGLAYQFETTSGPDTYMRLYSSDGFTIAAQDDNGYGSGNWSRIVYTPSASGWFYLEISQSSRSALSSNSNLRYYIVTPSAPAISTTSINCTQATVSWSGVSYAQGYEMQVSTSSSFSNSIAGNNCGGYPCNGGSDIGNVTSANITGLSTGTTYYVRLRARCGSSPCRSGWSNTLTINTLSASVTPASITGITTICSGGSTVLSASGGSLGSGAGYQWYSGGCGSGSVIGTGSSISVTPTNGQTFYVRYNGTCNTTSCASVSVNYFGALSAGAHNTSTLNGCSGYNPALINFTTSPSGGDLNYSYQWQLNGSDISGAGTSSYDPPALSPGTYSYRCKVTDGCNTVSYTSSKTINISADPDAPTATKTPSSTEVCSGATLTVSNPLYGTQAGQSCGFEYTYSTDGGATWATVSDVVPSFSATGSSNLIRVRVKSGCGSGGCDASAWTEYSWTVRSAPVSQSITPSVSPGTLCIGMPVSASFSGGSGGAGTVTDHYQFSVDGGNSWNTYTPGNQITSYISGINNTIIRTWRSANGTGCTNSSYNTIQWTVDAPATSQLNAGNLVWSGNSGTDWTTSSNWLLFNGSGFAESLVYPDENTDVFIRAYGTCASNIATVIGSATVRNITIESGKTLEVSGAVTLNVYGNWINNGNFLPGTGTVNLTGNTNTYLGGTSGSSFYSLSIKKALPANRVDVNGITIDILQTNSTNSLLLDEGILSLNTGSVFNKTTTGAIEIQPGATLVMDGGTFNGGNYSFDNSGTLNVLQGTINIGNSTGNELWNKNGSTFNMSGGALNVAARLKASGNASLNISGGDINLSIIGHSSSEATFSVQNTANFTMSGGNIIFNRNNAGSGTDLDINSTGSFNITGGSFRFGNIATPAGTDFRIRNSTFPFYDFVLSNCRYIYPLSEIRISHQMNLVQGYFKSESATILHILDNATIAGASNESFVDGPLSKSGDDAFEFPTGDIEGSQFVWAPIAISDPGNSSSDRFTAEYFLQPAPFNWSSGDMCNVNDMNHVSGIEYWEVTRNSGITYPDLTLYWKDASRSGINDVSNIVIGHREACGWKMMNGSASGASGTGATGSVTGTGFTAYSPVTIGTRNYSNPLPVELIGFDAHCSQGKVQLKWATASETNNHYFTLSKSKDLSNWIEVAKVDGAVNSNQLTAYSFEDFNIEREFVYYRLSQTDLDGKTEYFAPIAISCASDGSLSVSIFPNPFGDELWIDAGSNNGGEMMDIRITDVMGKCVYTFNGEISEGGLKKIDCSSLKPGMFLISIEGIGQSIRSRIVKQ